MEIVFDYKFRERPAVSFVLLDWSVRESCHMLDYLARQNVSRDLYEIIWVEYYQRRLGCIETGLRKSAALGTHPVVDKWVVMGTGQDVYYHKHLMYNVGILLSSGRIISICDSDAVVRETFVASIIGAFERDKGIVLHLDELRSTSRRFHPFCYPSLEEIASSECSNGLGGKPKGLLDVKAPGRIHSLNYGACMCALREDLIAIGGADEHVDYLGHISGPYEMTFRLINAGKRELWHPEEWLYHTWHPGEGGKSNYFGPHDRRHMSTTAIAIMQSGRVMPLVENPAINTLRVSDRGSVSYASLVSQVVPEAELGKWKITGAGWSSKKYWVGGAIIRVKGWAVDKRQQYVLFKGVTEPFCHAGRFWKRSIVTLWSLFELVRTMVRQSFIKVSAFRKGHFEFIRTHGGISAKLRVVGRFIKRMWKYDMYVKELCQQCLDRLVFRGIAEVAVYGVGDVTRMLHILSWHGPVRISGIYDDTAPGNFLGFKVQPVEALRERSERVVVASVIGTEDRVRRLKELSIGEERMVLL